MKAARWFSREDVKVVEIDEKKTWFWRSKN